VRAVRLAAGDSLAASLVVGDAGHSLQDDDVLISSTNGMMVRVALKDINVLSKVAKGHRAVKLKDGDEVGTITIVQNKEAEDY
jgi:DNA gyrase/topoisomerase IV subunit A